MKKLLFILSLVFVINGFGQGKKPTNKNNNYTFENSHEKYKKDSNGLVRCATVEYNEILKNNNLKQDTDANFEDWINEKVEVIKKNQSSNSQRITNTIITIPVVIHIIHNGDVLGTGENITDAQAASQIEVMNQDYRKMLGTRGYNTHADGADVEIEFCLAKFDPNGNPTTGIVRHVLSNTSWTMDQIETSVKPQTIWDPTRYMNMWTVRFGGDDYDLLGYAQFPDSSNLSGIDVLNGSSSTDGVVASYNAFGSIDYNDGSFIMNSTYKYGRTMTHEVGHFLGLRHIWGDGGYCGSTDYCDDTPWALDANFGCPTLNSCDDTNFGWITNPNDMVENYMDYTDDDCMNIFTEDQKYRMLAVMQNSPRRKELVTSNVCSGFLLNGVGELYGTCIPNNVVVNFNYTPASYFTETVTFSATGLPVGAIATFSPVSSNSATSVQLTISNISNTGTYNFKILGTSNGSVNEESSILKVFNSNAGTVTLQSPSNNSTGIELAPTLYWTEDTNALNYQIQISSNSTFTSIVEDKVSNTNSHAVVNTLSPLTKYYWRVKPMNNCGEGSFSSIYNFTTSNPSYCTSTYTEAGSEYIANVKFNTINKTSGDATSNGYENFTATSTTVNTGSTYTLSVTINTQGNYLDHCFAYIDWNKDFVFNNTNEKYDLGNIANVTAGILSQSITVPATALSGNTRMRVSIEYEDSTDGVGYGACDSDHLTEWGETEDYTVNVVVSTSAVYDYSFKSFNVFPNPSNGLFNITLQSNNSDKAIIQLFDMSGRLIRQNTLNETQSEINSSVDYSDVSNGIYLMKISKGDESGVKRIVIE